MKVIGGNFGTTGKATINGDAIYIQASRSKEYGAEEVRSVHCDTEKESRFRPVGAIAGIIIFGVLLGFMFGPIGFLIAVVMSIAGGFANEKTHTEEIEFDDGQAVTLQLKEGEVDRVYNLLPES